MFRPIYPLPHTGAKLKAHDMRNWFGIKGDESRLVRCKFCGWICDPDKDMRLKDGSFAGKGVDYGSQQSATITYPSGKTETNYYYEPEMVGGCPNCGSFLYDGGK